MKIDKIFDLPHYVRMNIYDIVPYKVKLKTGKTKIYTMYKLDFLLNDEQKEELKKVYKVSGIGYLQSQYAPEIKHSFILLK